MKKTLLLALFISAASFAQECCNVVDTSDVTVISSNGECVSTTDVIATACADQDGDGFIDSDDKCPTIAGTIDGCPDGDNDGVIDSKDKCPSIAGTLNGCPDSDKDGVIDSEDKCPSIAGTAKGCPDSDKDGIADKDDKCPELAGTSADNGCPADTDGDGVYDINDKCPSVSGSDNGCPAPLNDEVKAKLAEYPKVILFYTGKSTFKPGVTTTLDKIADLLKGLEQKSFTIEGHTDSIGSEASNLTLSQARAKAVADYLASHGVDGSKLSSKGYGESKPKASNNTGSGRAKNRRVEVIVK